MLCGEIFFDRRTMTAFVSQEKIEALLPLFTPDPHSPYTLSELIAMAEKQGATLSHLVVAQAMAQEKLGYEALLKRVMDSFRHNLSACELGLTTGRSFLLGKVASDVARANQNGPALIHDELINRALTYTLATEVGNHEMGLRPCAGTGDSCPYTGLIRALLEHPYPWERVAQSAALILKIGSLFRVGKQTTGCNMEGLGAGAAATAATLTELRGEPPPRREKPWSWPFLQPSPCPVPRESRFRACAPPTSPAPSSWATRRPTSFSIHRCRCRWIST